MKPIIQNYKATNIQKASDLPSPTGRVVTVPLDQLPAYFRIHHIEPNPRFPFPKPGTSEEIQVLIVRKISSEK